MEKGITQRAFKFCYRRVLVLSGVSTRLLDYDKSKDVMRGVARWWEGGGWGEGREWLEGGRGGTYTAPEAKRTQGCRGQGGGVV